MACCCPGGPFPENCEQCSNLTVRNTDCQAITRQTVCGNEYLVSVDTPCDCNGGVNGGIRNCENWTEGVLFTGCRCVELLSACERVSFSGGCDGNNNPDPCLKIQTHYNYTNHLYVFDGETCSWRKIATLAPVSFSGVISAAGNCEGTADPAYIGCTPPDCEGPFFGCECNPLP